MKAGDVGGVVVVTAEVVIGGVIGVAVDVGVALGIAVGVVPATSEGEAALGKAVVDGCLERKDIWVVIAPGHWEANGPRAARCQQKVEEVCSVCRPRSRKRSDVVNWRGVQLDCQFNMVFPLTEICEPSSVNWAGWPSRHSSHVPLPAGVCVAAGGAGCGVGGVVAGYQARAATGKVVTSAPSPDRVDLLQGEIANRRMRELLGDDPEGRLTPGYAILSPRPG